MNIFPLCTLSGSLFLCHSPLEPLSSSTQHFVHGVEAVSTVPMMAEKQRPVHGLSSYLTAPLLLLVCITSGVSRRWNQRSAASTEGGSELRHATSTVASCKTITPRPQTLQNGADVHGVLYSSVVTTLNLQELSLLHEHGHDNHPSVATNRSFCNHARQARAGSANPFRSGELPVTLEQCELVSFCQDGWDVELATDVLQTFL